MFVSRDKITKIYKVYKFIFFYLYLNKTEMRFLFFFLSKLFNHQTVSLVKIGEIPNQINSKFLLNKNFFCLILTSVLKKLNKNFLKLLALKSYRDNYGLFNVSLTKKKKIFSPKKFWSNFQEKNLKMNWDKIIKNIHKKKGELFILKKRKKAIFFCNQKIRNIKIIEKQKKENKWENFRMEKQNFKVKISSVLGEKEKSLCIFPPVTVLNQKIFEF